MTILLDPQVKPTLTVAELAEVVGVGRAAAYEMVRSGQVDSFRVGQHKIRIPTAAVVRLLQQEHPDAAPAVAAESMITTGSAA
jgi:excisionase family DNA binding protein